MIQIYTSIKHLKEDYPTHSIQMSNDMYFMQKFNITMLDDTDIESLAIIDNIEIKRAQSGEIIYFKSPFGILTLADISTGCKTAINLNHIIKEGRRDIITLTECGENALLRCFDIADNTNVPVLLQHGDIEALKLDYKFNINNRVITDDVNILIQYGLEDPQQEL